MRRFLFAVAGAVCLALAACAGGGSSPAITTASGPPAAGSARLTVIRPTDLLNGDLTANVAVNGSVIANLNPGGSVSLDIPAGNNKISVSTWSSRGQYAANLNAVAGGIYAVEVFSPEKGVPPGPVLGPMAVSLGASLSEGGGVLQLRFVDPKDANDIVAKAPVIKSRS